MLDLKALKVFVTVADTANMTVAAKRLGLSQSAVSQAIRLLEDSLGAVLIDREHRPLALTPAGLVLRSRGVELVAEAETLYKTVRERAGRRGELLRFGMVDSFAATIGPPLIKSLLASTARLQIASGLSHDLGTALLERRLDMIITPDPPDAAIAIECRRLLREPYVLLLPKQLGDAVHEPTLDDLGKMAPFVRFNIDSYMGGEIERYLRRESVVPPQRLEIDTANSVVAMVAAGVGWALITPLCLLQARADPDTVSVVALRGAGPDRELTLVSRRGEYGDLPQEIARTAAEIFRAECRPFLSRLAPWLVDAVRVG